jgi:alkylhydroperoxidase family enzyme
VDINSAVSRASGLADDELSAIAQQNDSIFSRRERLALSLANEMAKAPCNISDELYTQLRSEFTEEQLIELAAHIAFENNRARFNRVFDVGTDALYCPLPAKPR